MTIDLYYINGSAPCRAVLLAAKALGIDLNLKYLDLMKGEHLTPEFIQYGKDDSLYPKDPKQRAVVDQRLYFDLGTLYARYAEYYYPVYFGSGTFEPAKLERIKEAFNFLNVFLENQEFAAGNNLTIADFA
ncbi:hypothetical protein WA026_014512 [Henosepilachna vigintioctopunctata]|uniref:GST C-terminal domain-containing protein n=1 Tax=Henosepilachna vigintioctopunctata TaxID=420089 RepID=A0AAW1UDU8_9CUCU